MPKPTVYITRRIPEAAVRMLSTQCEIEVNQADRSLTKEELLAKVRGKNAVMTMLSDTIDAAVLDAAGPQCMVIANYAVGFNNIDIPAATERGIFATNTPDVLTDATADMAWALLFAVARRVVEGDRFTRAGKFKGWEPLMMLGMEVTGKTIGIIGAGRIGQAFAKRAQGFSMKILYTANKPKPEFEAQTGATFTDRDTLLRESDFVSLHVPLTPSTRHLIGGREFRLMKKTAILINTARGPVVDEQALVQALREKRIWGAGLDVFEREPQLEPGLAELENVVIPPHLGSATIETRDRMGGLAAKNILSALAGNIPPNCLNPDAKNRGRSS
jgi:glyoxylate reductase